MDDLTVHVKFGGTDDQSRRTEIYRNIHHAECSEGVLQLHSSEYGLVFAFSPETKWREVEVQTPPRGKKPGEA